MRRLLLGVSAECCWLGCAGPQVSDYAREQPNLELSDYFNGELCRLGGCFRTVPGRWSSASMWL